jgi:DHA1 family tetracycline resistance protein-like MFS transporter
MVAQPSSGSELPGQRFLMPILLVTIMLSGMGFGLVLPSFLFYAQNLGASVTIAAMILGSYSIGQFIATPIWGRMSDRHGRKPMLLLSLAGLTLSYVLLALSENLWLLALARAMNGLMAGNIAVAMAYVSDITPIEKRAQGMGYVGGSISLGFIVGPMIGGLLGGADAESASLFLPGIAATGVCAITFVATLFLRESLSPEQRAKANQGEKPGIIVAAKQVFRRPVMTRLVLAGFLVYFAMALFETIMPLWAQARFDWGPRDVGYSFTYLGLVVTIVQGVLVGRLAPIFGESKLVMFGLIAYFFGLLFMTQAPTWQWMMFGITFTAGGGAMVITSMSSLVSAEAAEDERGLVLGVYNSGSWMGRAGGPAASGLIFEGIGVQAPLYGAALIMLPCLALVARVRARLRRRDAKA